MKFASSLLAGACAVLFAGCASTPDVTADTGADAPKVASAKCNRNTDAPTGSSITRRDCSSNPDVSSAGGQEFMDSKRMTLPSSPVSR